VATSAQPSVAPSVAPATAGATAPPTASPLPPTPAPTAAPTASPAPTAAPLRLEIVQSQAWTDNLGNVRANVLLRNPYAFPVATTARSSAKVLNAAGEMLRMVNLAINDGLAGPGFFLPGETIAGNACFTCERALLDQPWSTVEFSVFIGPDVDDVDYSTQVEATAVRVRFAGDSPIFDIDGTVKNNGDAALDVISARVIVYDPDGKLIGAGEASAWDVAPGASASLSGYGFGQTPAGAYTTEVSALGYRY
jgi:hypothetical protein